MAVARGAGTGPSEAAKPLVEELAMWLQAQRGTLSRSATVAKPHRLHAHAMGSLRPFLDEMAGSA